MSAMAAARMRRAGGAFVRAPRGLPVPWAVLGGHWVTPAVGWCSQRCSCCSRGDVACQDLALGLPSPTWQEGEGGFWSIFEMTLFPGGGCSSSG